MQISVISLMILPSPWLCGTSVVNMSSGTREFGKCVKTQLQLVCSNYGSGEFVTTSLLIKRDFLIWINVIYKGKFQSSRRRFCSRNEASSERGCDGSWVCCCHRPGRGRGPSGGCGRRGAVQALPGAAHPSVWIIGLLLKWPVANGVWTISTRG